jgi:hypothetical protein
MEATTGGKVEQFKIGDLVEYNDEFDLDINKSVGLVVEIQHKHAGLVVVQWFNHPHADVIGDTLGYGCFELKRAEGKKSKNVE